MEILKVDGFQYRHHYITADGKRVWVCTDQNCTVKMVTTVDKKLVRKVGKHEHKQHETGYAPGKSMLADFKRKKEKFLSEKERVKKIKSRAEMEKKKSDFDRKLREAILRTNFLEELMYAQL